MAYNQDRSRESGEKLSESIIFVRRTAKVVQGGRVFRFSSLAVIGNGRGGVGFGCGKSRDAQNASRKAIESAKKNIKYVDVKYYNNLKRKMIGKYGASQVIITPNHRDLKAGGVVKTFLKACGINKMSAKCIGSKNPLNVVRAISNVLLLKRRKRKNIDRRERDKISMIEGTTESVESVESIEIENINIVGQIDDTISNVQEEKVKENV